MSIVELFYSADTRTKVILATSAALFARYVVDGKFFSSAITFVKGTQAKLFGRKKFDPDYKLTSTRMVWPADLDYMFHMNNARYFRHAEDDRIAHLFKSGLWNAAERLGYFYALGSLAVRFRVELPPFKCYRIVSQFVAYDERCMYFQQVFVSGPVAKPVVHTILLCRVHIVPKRGKKGGTDGSIEPIERLLLDAGLSVDECKQRLGMDGPKHVGALVAYVNEASDFVKEDLAELSRGM